MATKRDQEERAAVIDPAGREAPEPGRRLSDGELVARGEARLFWQRPVARPAPARV